MFAACLLPAADLAWRALRPDGLGVNPIEEAEIFTGLWTLRFLAITLSVTPARELLHLGFLARYRRMFGLFTFFYACVHLAMWAGVDWFFAWGLMAGEIVKHKYILVGMASFLLLLPLALTSTNGAVRRLGGRRWARLHRLVYLIAIGGTVHYLWAVKKDTLFPLIYLTVFVGLLAYRVATRWGLRRTAPAPAPSPSGAANAAVLQRSE